MAFALGIILPLQAAINARLARGAGNPVVSAFVSFAVGTLALLTYLLLTRQFSFRFVSNELPWWSWTGGLLGCFFVAGILVLLPRLGVALSFALVIAGQMFAAILFDQFGWMGLAVRPVNTAKIIGTMLIIAGVILIRRN